MKAFRDCYFVGIGVSAVALNGVLVKVPGGYVRENLCLGHNNTAPVHIPRYRSFWISSATSWRPLSVLVLLGTGQQGGACMFFAGFSFKCGRVIETR
jgi:hypothetical protein